MWNWYQLKTCSWGQKAKQTPTPLGHWVPTSGPLSRNPADANTSVLNRKSLQSNLLEALSLPIPSPAQTLWFPRIAEYSDVACMAGVFGFMIGLIAGGGFPQPEYLNPVPQLALKNGVPIFGSHKASIFCGRWI